MIEFDKIHKDLIPVLKENGITEKDLFHHYTDLYIGCKSYRQAEKIMNSGKWKSLSVISMTNPEGDMADYPWLLDIAFAVDMFQ